jgi:hypothetical protein
MTPTRPRTLLGLGLSGFGLLAYLVAALAYGSLPVLPRYAPVSIVLLALVEGGMAKVVRDRLAHRLDERGRPKGRPLHPMQVARAAVLAKASSAGGAVLLGIYGGLLAWTLPRRAMLAATERTPRRRLLRRRLPRPGRRGARARARLPPAGGARLPRVPGMSDDAATCCRPTSCAAGVRQGRGRQGRRLLLGRREAHARLAGDRRRGRLVRAPSPGSITELVHLVRELTGQGAARRGRAAAARAVPGLPGLRSPGAAGAGYRRG